MQAPGIIFTSQIKRGSMNTFGNIIWLIFGGLFSAIGYFAGGLALCFTLIGIPFGWQCFKLGSFMLWPFGRTAISTTAAAGCLPLFFNLLWLLFAGIWIALAHLLMGALLCLTLIGIPFGRQHFKMIEIALMPFGKTIINTSMT